MSIPKEPRQLMINLMYIVLTALLALNVSAEILNAFFVIDKSLVNSNYLAKDGNRKLMNAIQQQADAYAQYAPIQNQAVQIQQIANTFFDYVEKLKTDLIELGGGLDENNYPKKKKNKDIPTRYFIQEENAMVLKQEVIKTREDLFQIIADSLAQHELNPLIPLHIPQVPDYAEDKSWEEFTFQQMPIASVLPLLTKFQSDIRTAETVILNYLLNKTDNTILKPDAFAPVVAADKSYVIKGEPFSAEIFLGAYSSTSDNISVKVDGHSIPVRNGKAVFTRSHNDSGERQHEAIISLRSPITDEVKTFKKSFSYQVGERSVTTAADKMNVFYLGVKNPLSVSAAGVPSHQVLVNGTNVNLSKSSSGKYIVEPKKQGKATITVTGGGLEPTIFEYRVKKIPDPVMKLGRKIGGTMTPAEFKAHQGIIPHLENFDFETQCKVAGFEIARVPKSGDVERAENLGGRYQERAQRIVKKVKRNDVFYFNNIKVKCPGDRVGRELSGMIFNIR